MKKQFYRKDNDNLASLVGESYQRSNSPEYYDEEGHEDEEDDFEMGLGGEFDETPDDGLEMGMDNEVVMEIEPEAPVEPEFGADEVNEVLVSDLKKLAEYAGRLQEMSQSAEFDDWMVAKITTASDYVSDVWHRLDAKADFANTGFEQAGDIELEF